MQEEKSNYKNEVEVFEDKITKNPLATEKISKLIMKFGVPCIISLLVSSLYNIIDQIFIGQVVGPVGNAATNIVFPITIIAAAVALLIGDGAAAYLSLNLGRNYKKTAEKGIHNAIVMLIITGVIFLICGLIFRNKLINIFGMGSEKEVLDIASQFMFVIILGLPAYIFSTGMNSIIRADGSPKYAMVSMLSGAIINIFLDAIAIFALNMGATGAAVATVIAQTISAIIALIYLKKFKNIKIHIRELKIRPKIAKQVCMLGISSFITQTAITAVIIVNNKLFTQYGAESKYGSVTTLAVFGIVMKVNQIFNSIIIGIAVGAQPIIGYNYGAKDYKRVKETILTVIKMTFTVSIVATIIFQLFPEYIVNIFGKGNELYMEFACKCFRTFLMFVIFGSFQIVLGIFFQAMGKPLKAMTLSLSRQILFLIPAAIILSSIYKLNGILYAGPTADILAGILASILLIRQIKKINKLYKVEKV